MSDRQRAYQLVFVSLGLIYAGVDLKLTEPGQQSAVVPVCQVGVEHGGQGQGAHHHPQDGQDPGQAQAGAGHGHWQLNTEPGQPGRRRPPNISQHTLSKHQGLCDDTE